MAFAIYQYSYLSLEDTLVTSAHLQIELQWDYVWCQLSYDPGDNSTFHVGDIEREVE